MSIAADNSPYLDQYSSGLDTYASRVAPVPCGGLGQSIAYAAMIVALIVLLSWFINITESKGGKAVAGLGLLVSLVLLVGVAIPCVVKDAGQ